MNTFDTELTETDQDDSCVCVETGSCSTTAIATLFEPLQSSAIVFGPEVPHNGV